MDNRSKKSRRHEEMEDDLLEKQLKDYVHGSDKEEDGEEQERGSDQGEEVDEVDVEMENHKKRKLSSRGQISDIDIAGPDDEEEAAHEKVVEEKEDVEYEHEEDIDDEDKDGDYEQEEDAEVEDEEEKKTTTTSNGGRKAGRASSGGKNDAEAAVSTIRIHYQDLSGSARPDTTIDVSDPEDLMEHLRSKGEGDDKRRRGRITKVTEETIQDWRKIRKESHKEVERRRRETINLAIDNLRKLLPKPEYSKAGILTSAAALIKKLKESESNHMNKWAISRIVAEQTKTSSEKAQEKMSEALDQSYKEIIRLRSILEENNIKFEDKFIIPEDALTAKPEKKEEEEEEEEEVAKEEEPEVEGEGNDDDEEEKEE
ncbi:Centromere-binding protein 1 [Nakaseomyces bracarensis]|uniref:Centromere-binding protein 1 n=1 Tax=Nakaseomyces bracarensis TaxID=273131 RepID=A0ABR4NTW9_9SACH